MLDFFNNKKEIRKFFTIKDNEFLKCNYIISKCKICTLEEQNRKNCKRNG